MLFACVFPPLMLSPSGGLETTPVWIAGMIEALCLCQGIDK